MAASARPPKRRAFAASSSAPAAWARAKRARWRRWRRASSCRSPPLRSTARPCSAATRRWCSRSASAWAARPPRSRRRRPSSTFSASRSIRPASARCCSASMRPGSRTCASSSTTPSRSWSRCSRRLSLAGVHVFFPDPWHKKRHHKRRLVQPAFVGLLASRLAAGGRLHCATDWQPYAEQMLDVLAAEPTLVNAAAAASRRAPRAGR